MFKLSFSSDLISIVTCDYFSCSVQIDEANKGAKYLGIVARYLPNNSFSAKVVCIDPPVLSSTTSEQMAASVINALDECRLQKKNCVAIMTDSCNAMRGAKSGTVARLKNEDFTSIIDHGGCSLHHVANVARHACSAADLGNKVEALVKDVHCYFKFSQVERSHFDHLIDSFTEIKKVVFLRPVDTR